MKTIWLMIIPLILVACDAPVNVPIHAPVSVEPNVQPGAVIVESGMVAPGAVNIDPNAVKVSVLGALQSAKAELAAVIRNSEQKADGEAYASTGGDSKQSVVTVTLDGSGWPLVGVGVICIGAVAGWLWYRHKAEQTGGWLSDVATQVQTLPAQPKKTLIDQISGRVRDEKRFKEWLSKGGLRADKPKDG